MSNSWQITEWIRTGQWAEIINEVTSIESTLQTIASGYAQTNGQDVKLTAGMMQKLAREALK